jgi:hypothetical protein
MRLGRSLPYQSQQDLALEPGAARYAAGLPRFRGALQRPSPKAVDPWPAWDYTPFGRQKPPPEPPAPFESAPQPDAPPRVPEPEPAELEPEPEPAPRPEEPVRLPPRLHLYEDLAPYQPPAEPDEASPRQAARAAEQRDRPRRLGRSVYDAVQTHGHFGLVDGGETLGGGVRRVVVHVPKRSRGYALDLRPGEVIYANSARGTQARGRLDVLFVSRYKYVPPGHAVTSCVIGVAEEQWRRFMK